MARYDWGWGLLLIILLVGCALSLPSPDDARWQLSGEILDWRDDLYAQENVTDHILLEIDTLYRALQDEEPSVEMLSEIQSRIKEFDRAHKLYLAKSQDYKNYLENNQEAIMTDPFLQKIGFDPNEELREITEEEVHRKNLAEMYNSRQQDLEDFKNYLIERENDVQPQLVKNETLVLYPGDSRYYGGTHESPGDIVPRRYVVSSSEPLDIYVVPSESDFRLIETGQAFVNYPDCKGVQVLRYDAECTIYEQGGIVLINDNSRKATVDLTIYSH